ncbi:LPS-assembly protein LptD, partial [Clarias magur]
CPLQDYEGDVKVQKGRKSLFEGWKKVTKEGQTRRAAGVKTEGRRRGVSERDG